VSDLSEAPADDVAEQHDPVDGVPGAELVRPLLDENEEANEADWAEQSTPVEATEERLVVPRPDDVNEADWLDQTVVERDPDEDADRY
jgi:hypothetical protein